MSQLIQITGSAQRYFSFPANLPTAMAYYSNLVPMLVHLPHICLIEDYGNNQFQACYTTTELGIYQVKIYCNLQAFVNPEVNTLQMVSLDGAPQVEAEAGFNFTTATGHFASKSVFFEDEPDRTNIQYSLELRAELPKPFGLKYMFSDIVDKIAGSITYYRIDEIAEGFIKNSIKAFPQWKSRDDTSNQFNTLDPKPKPTMMVA